MDHSRKAKRRSIGINNASTKKHHKPPQNLNGRTRKQRNGERFSRKRNHSESDNSSTGEIVELERSTEWVDADKYTLWPKWTIVVIYLVTLVYRIYIIQDTNSWWILHPDEVFQSLEVAHSEVYGYGFRPYEYLPPHSPGEKMTSLADRQEAEMGMYSLRSWIYPRMYIQIFHFKEMMGIDSSPFLVGKLFHGIIAAHLPVAVFAFTNCLTCSPDIATSAAILAAFSEHLATLGTHTLINSFMSPFLFSLLSLLHCTFVDNKIPPPNSQESNQTNSEESGTSFNVNSHKTDLNGNANILSPHLEKTLSEEKSNGNVSSNGNPVIKSGIITPGNDTRTEKLQVNKKLPTAHKLSLVLLGLSFALLVYIRVDSIIFCALVGIFLYTDMLTNIRTNLKKYMYVIIGGIAGFFIGGLDDLYSYGIFMISPYQWIRFNVITDLSNVLFGFDSTWTYINTILNYNLVTKLQTILIVITLILVIYRLLFKDDTERNKQLGNCLIKLVLATSSLFILYSLKGHKEVRFMHNVIVLFQIASALSFCIIYRHIIDSVQYWQNTLRLHGRLFFILFLVNLAIHFPSPKDRTNQAWSYRSVWDSHHINECLDFIRQQPDVTGVVSDRILHETATYSLLHKDVPIFTLFHYEFMEFDESARKVLPSNDYFSNRETVSVSVTSKVSNFITIENSPLLLKTIVNEPNYNYLLLKTSRKLVNVGFKEIYKAGTMRVLKRTQDQKEEDTLQQIARAIPIGRNATILEYEGSWLMKYGLRQLARERLEEAIALDSSRVRAFQVLSKIYQDMGRTKDARDMTLKCFVENSRDKCMEIQQIVVLHKDYQSS